MKIRMSEIYGFFSGFRHRGEVKLEFSAPKSSKIIELEKYQDYMLTLFIAYHKINVCFPPQDDANILKNHKERIKKWKINECTK